VIRAGLDAGERVGDSGGGTPWHGEDHVQRDVQRFGAVDVAVAGWIGEDEVGPERGGVGPLRIRFGTGAPRRREDLGDHCPFLRHILDDLVEACRDNAAAGFDDVLHQRMRIAAEGIELEPGMLDHGPELAVGRDAHAVPLRQPAADRDERLDVAARADDHDDDGQGRHGWRLVRGGGGRERAGVCGEPRRDMSEAIGGVIEVHPHTRAGPGRDGLEPAHGSGPQAPVVEPPPQEGRGRRVEEAPSPVLTHRCPSSTL
jgi:hypothetical protein